MTGLQNTHRTMARQPWRELERPQTLRLYYLWQGLPDMLQTRPFGELSGHVPVASPAPSTEANEKLSARTKTSGSNSAGNVTKKTSSATRPIRNAAQATLPARENVKNRELKSFTEAEGRASADAVTRNSHERKKRPGFTKPTKHTNENFERKPDSEALNATRIVYDLAARRVVTNDHCNAGRQTQPIQEKRNAAAPSEHRIKRDPKATEADTPARSDDRHQGGVENALAAIRTALSARGARSNTTDANRPICAPGAPTEPRRPIAGAPQPTVSDEPPASPNPVPAADGTRARLGEQLMDLVNDTLVREARRHGVDI